ncbi:hypothetical protein EON65_36825 [archaeon]|nr:MAG: hypothetical protein EON65_36825 [archaeon]
MKQIKVNRSRKAAKPWRKVEAKAINVQKAVPLIVSSTYSRESFIEDLVSRKYRKIVFLVGAGISVAAGIPDFRSPGTGLYWQLRDVLACPEDIFSLDCFEDDPKPFFQLAKQLIYDHAQPVKAHRFMKLCESKKLIHMVYTQNIDGLELLAGIPPKKVMQAHGHMRSAHCIKCRKLYPIDSFVEYAQREEIMYCVKCQHLVKPDIIFFGEHVNFSSQIAKISTADLIVVMGTSLQVKPFSELLKLVSPEVPLVMVNRDLPRSLPPRSNFLFLQGDIEEEVDKLCADVGWDLNIPE